jgi:hypothetical protein
MYIGCMVLRGECFWPCLVFLVLLGIADSWVLVVFAERESRSAGRLGVGLTVGAAESVGLCGGGGGGAMST